MNTELVYSIKDIFTQCLDDYGATRYYIAAYQRGYKWSSKTNNDQVPTLISDLKSAFENNKNKEYYLQYITIKNNQGQRYLEVIDGQQRLTTLSILQGVLTALTGENNSSKNKLTYAVRDSGFLRYIYDLDETSISGVLNYDMTLVKKQDEYYMREAIKFINGELKKIDQLTEFYSFLLYKVKIIVNAVEQHVDSEKVFLNLNNNKIPLTEAELIKGLLITKAAREPSLSSNNKRFREITEVRASMGRQWDEMNRWANDKKISAFITGHKGMETLLSITALKLGYVLPNKINTATYPLFNFFNQACIKDSTNNSILNLAEVFNELKLTWSILNDWFQDKDIYNLMGYLSYTNQLRDLKFISDNLYSRTSVFKEVLKQKVLGDIKAIASKDEEITYENNQDAIRKILLAINLFEIDANGLKLGDYRFPFEKLSTNPTKSIEHIYPQNPSTATYIKDVSLFEYNKQFGLAIDTIEESNLSPIEQEKKQYSGRLHTLGNLALVTVDINSSLSNHVFAEKRENLKNQIIKKGKFVPPHTYDVFNKAFSGSGELSVWTLKDIQSNYNYIESKINFIKSQN